eukprot:4712139-Alexandrium_andersonii.AAC.1
MYAFDSVVAPAGPSADLPLPVGGVDLPDGAVVHNMGRLEALLAPPAVDSRPVGAGCRAPPACCAASACRPRWWAAG